MSVRDLVRAIQREMRDSIDLQPDRASELLNQATALLGNCNEQDRRIARQVLSRSVRSGSCWLWTGSQDGRGYGITTFGGRGGRSKRVHRALYEALFGA